jgi:hypothetical protein
MRHLAALTLALAAFATPAAAMTIDDVFALLQAGVNESVILDQVEAEDARFRLETEDILALKNVGASDHLVRSLIATSDGPVEEEGGSWSDDYYSNDYYQDRSSMSLSFTYDPFGYYWYSSPYYYGYYYPFRTINFGWYYGGCLSRSWWGWHAYWPTYYRDYCAVWYPRSYHHHGNYDYDGPRSRTRHAYVDRDNDRYRDRDGRAYTRDTSRRSIDRTRTPRATERQRDPAAIGRSPERDRERGRAWSDRGGTRDRAPRADQAPRSTGRKEVREPRRSSSSDRSSPAPTPRSRGGEDRSGGSRRWGR